jgi:glycosyltransferase involved in cell wall biosynthesis
MKILWLTPTHSRSAIARFSKLVTDALYLKGYGIRVCSIESEFKSSDCQGYLAQPVLSFANIMSGSLDDEYDAIVVNFGDHYPNHALCLDAINHRRVVGIFHDADMTNFGNGTRAIRGKAGNEILPVGTNVTEALARRCDGVVAHSDFYISTLEACDGPIARIPLAWALPEGIQRRRDDRRGSGSESDQFTLLTFGNINVNKCADRVISAIGMDAVLKRHVAYRLVGAIEPDVREKLTKQARELEVNLTIVGAVEDKELHQELVAADGVSCLRNPVLEGASASAIEAMLHGCAVMVSDAGFYQGLPDDTVRKVPEETAPASIAEGLLYLLKHTDARIALGQRAHQYATTTFAPEAYSDHLVELVQDVRIGSAYHSAIKSTAKQLSRLGIKSGTPSADIVLRALETMAPVERRDTE